jgi:hypothetical protein
VIAAVAAIAFSGRILPTRIGSLAHVWTLLVVLLLLGNARLNVLDIQYVKGALEPKKLFEGWNSFSRVAVFADNQTAKPYGWGLSARYPGANPGWMRLNIDGMAETPITRFDGRYEPVEFLKWDVSTLAYNLKKEARAKFKGLNSIRWWSVRYAIGSPTTPVTSTVGQKSASLSTMDEITWPSHHINTTSSWHRRSTPGPPRPPARSPCLKTRCTRRKRFGRTETDSHPLAS